MLGKIDVFGDAVDGVLAVVSDEDMPEAVMLLLDSVGRVVAKRRETVPGSCLLWHGEPDALETAAAREMREACAAHMYQAGGQAVEMFGAAVAACETFAMGMYERGKGLFLDVAAKEENMSDVAKSIGMAEGGAAMMSGSALFAVALALDYQRRRRPLRQLADKEKKESR